MTIWFFRLCMYVCLSFGIIRSSKSPSSAIAACLSFVSPLRVLWCVMAMLTLAILREANWIEPDHTTLFAWVCCTLITLVIERQLHIKKRFTSAAKKGRRRLYHSLGKRFHKEKDGERHSDENGTADENNTHNNHSGTSTSTTTITSPLYAPKSVDPALVSPDKTPLLVFVNVKSGGGIGNLLVQELLALGFDEKTQVCQFLLLHSPVFVAFLLGISPEKDVLC